MAIFNFNRFGVKMETCAGCNYTYENYSMNDAGNGLYYCGGCNQGQGQSITPPSIGKGKQAIILTSQSTQEIINQIQDTTFTSTHEPAKPKLTEEDTNLKPAEQPTATKEPKKEEENPDFFDKLKDREAEKYFNAVNFKTFLRKKKGLTDLPFHIFKSELNTMRLYWKEWIKWANKDDKEAERERERESRLAMMNDFQQTRERINIARKKLDGEIPYDYWETREGLINWIKELEQKLESFKNNLYNEK